MTKIVLTLIFQSLIWSCFGSEKSFYDDHARGWHWYEAGMISAHDKNQKENISLQAKALSATEELKRYQEELEEAKAKAVLHPTSRNVLAYQEMQFEMTQKAGEFSEVWMRNVYKNPSIDYSTKFPTSQKARHVYLTEQMNATEKKIAKLSKEYGLFYFFKGDCPYCDQFAVIVKMFSKKYRWEVLAISEYGEKNETFARSVKDNGLAETWGVSIYPSLFAVNPKSGHVIPIANGMISIQEIEERIISLSEELEEKDE